jgi:hypothetical protein
MPSERRFRYVTRLWRVLQLTEKESVVYRDPFFFLIFIDDLSVFSHVLIIFARCIADEVV